MSIRLGEFLLKKFISQSDMRIANILEVLSLIRKEKSITRKDIQNRTGLSWGGVSQIVSRLMELSYVIEKKVQDNASSGRTPSSLEINAYDNYIIGIDINMSGLYAVVVNLRNEIVYDKQLTADVNDKDAFLGSVYTLLDFVTKKYEKHNVIAIGVAMQGTVNSNDGVSVSLEVDGWENVPLCDILTARYNIPAYIAHDPDCILSAATRENKADAMLVRIDSGIGMAVIKDENLIVGTGMHEIGKSLICFGEEVKSLVQLMQDGEGTDALGLAVANSLIMYNVNKLFVCGSASKDEVFVEKLESAIKRYIGDEISFHIYDAKRAAFGAAIFAIEDYLRYIK